MAEMIIRCIVGLVAYFAINITYLLFLLCLWGVNLVLMPLFNLVDKSSLIEIKYDGRRKA